MIDEGTVSAGGGDQKGEVSARREIGEQVGIEVGGATVKGSKYIENHDAMIADPKGGLLAVMDGVGTSGKAKEAAFRAEQDILWVWESQGCRVGNVDEGKEFVIGAIENAHRGVRATDGGTTVVIAVPVRETGQTQVGKMVVGHVGNSRMYIKRNGQNVSECLTLDDTLLSTQTGAEAVKDVLKRGQDAEDRGLKRETVEGWDFNKAVNEINLDRVLGQNLGQGEEIEVRVQVVDVQPGDEVLLCSDGLFQQKWGNKGERDELWSKGGTPAEIAQRLAGMYEEVDDDLTVVIGKIK